MSIITLFSICFCLMPVLDVALPSEPERPRLMFPPHGHRDNEKRPKKKKKLPAGGKLTQEENNSPDETLIILMQHDIIHFHLYNTYAST